MRVYEFAKLHNMSSKDLLRELSSGGFNVASHMSILGAEEQQFLLNKNKKLLVKKSAVQENNNPKVEEEGFSLNSKINLEKEKRSSVGLSVSEVANNKRQVTLSPMTVGDLAKKIEKPVNELILFLLRSGIVLTKNEFVSEELIKKIAQQYDIICIEKKDEDIAFERSDRVISIKEKDRRLPVVVVVGHVDHGKTTLLDFIRKTQVTETEKGGITQHIGAYEAKTNYGNAVFIDTPGHEAFMRMRQRGLRIADIAILVVAADDGIKPQTVEAIRQAKAEGIPIIVAINKIDKVDLSAVDRVKQQLSQYDLLIEEWGGEVVCVPVSASTGEGVEGLLEMLLLQADIMDLFADESVPARGFVLESKVEKGIGSVATIIGYEGIINQGDFFVCGSASGRISILRDSQGQKLTHVRPSIPVQIAGFDSLPAVGDVFKVVSKNFYRNAPKGKGKDALFLADRIARKRSSVESSFNFILKADSHSSLEAVLDAIEKIESEGKINIVSCGVGNVVEADIDMASHTNSDILTFHVKSDRRVLLLASKSVKIHSFDIIYKLLEFLEEKILSDVSPSVEYQKTGEVEVLKVFNIKNVGVIAGCKVTEGFIQRNGKAIVWRNNEKVVEGKIDSLQRERKASKEVSSGFECAFIIKNFSDWVVGDKVECFIEKVPS